MKKQLVFIGKILAILLIMACIYIYALINFSTKDYGNYKCQGTLTNSGVSLEDQILIHIELYRKYLIPWVKYDGRITIETPNHYIYSLRINKSNDIWYIESMNNTFRGMIYRLSGTISIITPYGVFDGKIERADTIF